MRRAVQLLVLAALIGSTPAGVRAATVLDGAGMIHYAEAPNFKVGDWVKYRTKGSSIRGHKDDYQVTILIAGEELWWGERCFWVETWTESPGLGKEIAASLVTYGIFGDSMATEHLPWFLRKTIQGYDNEGRPQQLIHKRDVAEFRARRGAVQASSAPHKHIDTLGVESITGPIGTYEARKVRESVKVVELVDRGDSTIYYERIETRDKYFTPKVPITWLAREVIDDLQQGRSWLIGQKKDAPLGILERAQGTTELVATGHGDLKPEAVPVQYRRSIEEQERERAPRSPSSAPRKTTRKTGRSG